ncbi:MAG TPA: JAB domain-containing protein, partial [Hyphomonas sp.]|nr:JAB domain-containing protein [Hyphomonas sp.]
MSFVVNDSCVESLSVVAAQHEDWIIQQAIALLEQRVFKAGPRLDRPAAVRDYLRLKLVAEPNEVFVVVFMDSLHQVLAYEPMFRGTINSAT